MVNKSLKFKTACHTINAALSLSPPSFSYFKRFTAICKRMTSLERSMICPPNYKYEGDQNGQKELYRTYLYSAQTWHIY